MSDWNMPPAERAAFANGAGAERERCAKIVEGEIYKERYRRWPQVSDGNRAEDSEIAKHCAALAAIIRANGQTRGGGGNG